MVIAEQGDPHCLLRLTKQTQPGLGAGGTVDWIGWGRTEAFELLPIEHSLGFRLHAYRCSSLGSRSSRGARWPN